MKSSKKFSSREILNLAKRNPNSREAKELYVMALAEKARRSFGMFCRYVDPTYLYPKHLQITCEALDRVEQGKLKRLMILMPPRHGKSETVSRKFPSYALGKNPDRRIILTGYGQSLPKGFSRENRELIESRVYNTVFPITTKEDSRAVSDWGIQDHKGGLLASGIGGAITGYGADIFLIDDPIKNREEAESETYREKVWDWYQSVVLTRLEPNAALIIVLTPWHQDDLAGRIQKREDDWEIINLPAIYDSPIDRETGDVIPDPIGREDGEALWRKRYDEKYFLGENLQGDIDGLKFKVGSRVWNALYQCRPVDPKSQLCEREWIRWYDELPLHTIRIAGIDTATSKKTKADFMAVVDVCMCPEGYLYVDDVFLEKVKVPTFARHICNQQQVKNYVSIANEDNNAGQAIREVIEDEGRRQKVYPPIVGVWSHTDKIVRFTEWQSLIENGTLRFRRGNSKVADFVEHLINFDGLGSDVDDDVDACGHAIKAIKEGTVLFMSDATSSAQKGTERECGADEVRATSKQDW